MIEQNNKHAIWSAVIAAVASILLTYFITSFARIGDSVTHEEMVQEIEQSSEDVLQRSRRYTDDKVESMKIYYDTNIKSIEKLIQTQNDYLKSILDQYESRLNRMDKRIPE